MGSVAAPSERPERPYSGDRGWPAGSIASRVQCRRRDADRNFKRHLRAAPPAAPASAPLYGGPAMPPAARGVPWGDGRGPGAVARLERGATRGAGGAYGESLRPVMPTQRIAAILRQQGSPLAHVVHGVEDIRTLPRPVRERIVDVLGEEFAARGIESNGQPNAYGLALEALTDACGLAWDDQERSAADRHKTTLRRQD